jgi:hypothetical protein
VQILLFPRNLELFLYWKTHGPGVWSYGPQNFPRFQNYFYVENYADPVHEP